MATRMQYPLATAREKLFQQGRPSIGKKKSINYITKKKEVKEKDDSFWASLINKVWFPSFRSDFLFMDL